jgi:CheY-like chemotaxis protein
VAKILVVDDEPNNRLLLATILEHVGHEIVEAKDGAEALLIIKYGPPDLVVMDLHMPGMGGADFLKALRAEPGLDRVKVALYTATMTNPDLQQFMDANGIEHVIGKPSEPREVIDVVATILSA